MILRMQTARIVSYNADHFDPEQLSGDQYQYLDTGIENRFEHIPSLLSELEPDIILMQELYGTDQTQLEESARGLAQKLGFSCEFQGEVTAAKSQHHNLGTGVLWGPRFEPTAYTRVSNLWQPLNIVEGTIDGQPLTGASFHAQSVGKVETCGDTRPSDHEKLLAIARRYPRIILGADWNGISKWDTDPQPETPLHEVMTPREVAFVLNRSPANILEDGGLIDLAAYYAHSTGGILETTTGGRPTREGPQRLDRLYAWQAIAERICAISVIKTELAGKLSDHYPKVLDLDISPLKTYL